MKRTGLVSSESGKSRIGRPHKDLKRTGFIPRRVPEAPKDCGVVELTRKRRRNGEMLDTKKASRSARELAQRLAVRERSGGRCEFEVPADPRDELNPDAAWQRCDRIAGVTAHIYRRRECGSVKYHPDVALDACLPCHDAFDGRDRRGSARPPIEAAQRAFDAIDAALHPATPRPAGGRPVGVWHALRGSEETQEN